MKKSLLFKRNFFKGLSNNNLEEKRELVIKAFRDRFSILENSINSISSSN